ncbi:MAG: TonB-dependent receptor, partial [Gammaproteobacteria bacterium]|nr:TonB-dependent receptor [Gammaproteobacteria bacterium]
FAPSGPFSGAVLVRFNGEEPDRGGITLDDWVRVDISGRYMVAEDFEVFGRIENLFDTHYQQILGYGTPGLSGSLGLRWRF